ncbi:hypothetical protein CVD28_01825 [Bacillus sp. M6-12]|nr:methyl-accepting chemotaxis protein [Bacillus sp. M6-12]PLS19170.1 hypothetical protein CVD28_01825 [Bacillus sp. M6-12]
MSIKKKLPIFISGLVTASLLTTGIISYHASSKALLESAEQELHTNAERTANLIDSLQNGELMMGSIMANNKRVKDFVSFNNSGNEKEALSLESAVDKFLKDSYENTTNHAHLFVLDKKGKDIADSDSELEKQTNTYADRDYFKGAMAGKVTIGKMVVSKTSGKPVIVIGTPIKDDKGQVQGVLANSINAEFFTSNLEGIKLGEKGSVTIRDTDGMLISHPDKSLIGKPGTRPELNDFAKSVPLSDNKVNVKMKQLGSGNEKTIVMMANIPGTNWVVGFEKNFSEIQAPSKHILMNTILIAVIGIIVSTLLGLYFSRMITVPLSRLMNRMKEMSEGNLNVKMDETYKDEFKSLAESFTTMAEKMKYVIGDINSSVKILSQSTTELDQSSKNTTESIEELSATTQEISIAMESQAQDTEAVANQITGLGFQINEANEHAEHVQQQANQLTNVFKEKISVVNNLMDINEKNEMEVGKVSKSTQLLEESSSNIGNITKVIQGIAEQTNLLALNASIEAARAGEAGRGFSVVAEEIRKLAEQSSNSVRQIDMIIKETQRFTVENSESVKAIQTVSKEQNQYILETKDLFELVIGQVSEMTNLVQDVTNKLKDMNVRKDEVIAFIQNVSASGEEVSASVEEVSATSEEQSAMVQQLGGMIETIDELSKKLEESASIFKL